jgi:acetyl-CoA carboxylase biotin carboxyl carrier protein
MTPEDSDGIADYLREELPRVIRLVTESQVRELELHDGTVGVVIRRAPRAVEMVAAAEAGAGAVHMPPAEPTPRIRIIASPMVGTFYHSEQPGRASLIVEGGRVEQGALIGVIEALGVMTDVESDTAGVVDRILSPDGEAVEYGQPLVEVTPDD